MDQALADPGRTELLRRVVQAAGRSAIEDKVHALGRILATGLHDDGARIDEALPLAAALAELDPAHVRLLAHMADRGMYTDHPAQRGDRPRLRLHRLGEALPGSELVATSVMRTLERHGLADDPNPGVRQALLDHGVIKLVRVGPGMADELCTVVGGRPVYLHLDCDVLEPGIVATDYQVLDGMTLDDLHACATVLASRRSWASSSLSSRPMTTPPSSRFRSRAC